MAQHTPGPWMVERREPQFDAGETSPGSHGSQTHLIWTEDPLVAQVVAHIVVDAGLDVSKAEPQANANARLIAAAPKLKAIVEGFLGTLATNDAYQVHRYYDTNIELFNLAIDTIQELRSEVE